MTMAAFDTLKAVKRLKEAGLDEAMAEAMVETFGGPPHDSLATRDDLAATEEKLSAEIDQVRGEIDQVRTEIAHTEEKLRGEIVQVRGEIEHSEERLTLRIDAATAGLGKELFRAMFVMAFAIVGLTVTLIKLL